MMKIIFFIGVCMLSLLSKAQLLDSIAIDTMPVFKSMEEAMVNPDRVYRLDLTRDKLEKVPEGIKEFKNLNELILAKNKLLELPDFLVELKFLQRLSVAKNKFEVFPPQICRMTELIHLNVSQNLIPGFPTCIGNLKKLAFLDAYSTNVGVFPQEMRNLISLRFFDLRVVSLSDDEQVKLTTYLPKTEIKFSTSCNCGSQ